ncbi:MAG: hypothetical protein IJW40_08720 [Clostridia bacterium]|nr:hypothetical protein [Clostridia bacterium]
MIYNMLLDHGNQPAPPYRGTPRKYGLISQNAGADDSVLASMKREYGLFMSVGQLRMCLTQFKKDGTSPTSEALYLLDSLCELYASHPDTQVLLGYDTDAPDHADALSGLICRCRSIHGRETTPPLQLRTVLDALHSDLALSLPHPPYDHDPALHWTICDGITAASMRTQGYHPTATLDIAGSSLRLLCHSPQTQAATRRILRGDRLCLLHGTTGVPSAAECAAAEALFDEIRGDAVRRILPVAPQMLLPTALGCAHGLTIDTSVLPREDMSRYPLPCDITGTEVGGWLIIHAPAEMEALQRRAADFGLTLAPFATVRHDRMVEFAVLNDPYPVHLSSELLHALEITYAYRLTEDRTAHHSDAPRTPLTPLFLHKYTAVAGGQLADARGCGAWYVRTVTLPLDEESTDDALGLALISLRTALAEDCCPALADAAVLCGLEIAPTLSRTTLWRTVFELYHLLRKESLPCLPIALHHSKSDRSQLTLSLVCHKPHPDPADSSPDKQGSTLLPTAELPLPAHCSLIHTEHPEVLIAHTPTAGCVSGLAAILQEAGGVVHTLRISAGEQGCTVLADAIHKAQLVLFVGDDERLPHILTHRRVDYALSTLTERDGLCLVHGEAMHAFCRVGAFGEMLQQQPTCSPVDAFEGAFPTAIGYVRDLARPGDEPILRPLPKALIQLPEDAPVGDPMVEMFQAPELTERHILAVTLTDDGIPAAVRIVRANGHRIAYGDGFTAAQLQAAVRYFR